MAAARGFLAALCLATRSSALETGTVVTGIETFVASFSGDYVDPVVIAGVPSKNGEEQIVVRITNINTLTKTIQFYADPPGTQGAGAACAARFVGAEEFSWLIVESTVAGGSDSPLQAGTVMSPADPHKTMGRYADPDTWVDAVFSTPIQDPVCISQIQTHNGGDQAKTRQMPGIQGDRSTGCVPRCVECPDQISIDNPRLTEARPQCADGADCASIEGMEGSAMGMVCGADDPTRGFQISLEEDIAISWGVRSGQGDTGHKQEKFGWIALPAGSGQLGTLRYAAVSIPAITHELLTVPFQTDFATKPGVFGSLTTLHGQDSCALRRTGTTIRDTEIFIEEEMCSDEEMGHTAEGAAVLVIDNSHAVDSQAQATLPATLGRLTPPMQQQGDFVHVPNGVPGYSLRNDEAQAEFKFSCSAEVPEMLVAFEVRAPNGNDDSFYIALDNGDRITWHIPRVSNGFVGQVAQDGTPGSGQRVTGNAGGRNSGGGCVNGHCDETGGFHWATFGETFAVPRGKHTLHGKSQPPLFAVSNSKGAAQSLGARTAPSFAPSGLRTPPAVAGRRSSGAACPRSLRCSESCGLQ